MSDQKNDKILEVKNLKVSYHTYAGEVKSVRGVSFDLKEGEAIAIVGESGCGKSVTAKSIMGLIKGPQGEIKQGSEILYHGDNILNYNKKQWQAYKGGEVAIIFQDALASLNPTMRVGKQIMENLMAHKHMTKDEAKKEAIRMLQRVGIPEPEKRVRQYPHEFSGGMRQRVMIAIAFACDPKILICDEPTTALDVTIQGQILDIIKELQREHNTSVIMITPQGEIKQGSEILYHGDNILNYNKKQWQAYKGGEVAIIFQDALASLNPTMRVGKQIMENLMAHKHMTKDEAKKEAIRMLQRVGIPEPEKRVRQYPHEFSGGMRQRVMIAIAFACDPKILICDEPTTALDVTIQGQILDIIKELQREHNTSVIMITHDLGVVANIAQKIAVMYSGMIVERGNCEDIFYRPRHPYTWALIRSVPRLDLENKQVLASIPGTPPDLLNPPVGCPFCTRCEYCMEICKEQMPEVTEFGDGHEASCWLHHPLAPKVEMPGEA